MESNGGWGWDLVWAIADRICCGGWRIESVVGDGEWDLVWWGKWDLLGVGSGVVLD